MKLHWTNIWFSVCEENGAISLSMKFNGWNKICVLFFKQFIYYLYYLFIIYIFNRRAYMKVIMNIKEAKGIKA